MIVSYRTEVFVTSSAARDVQLYSFFALVFIVTNFTTINWILHLLMRQLIAWVTLLFKITQRNEFDDNNIAAGIILTFLILLSFELVLYTNYHAKARLFSRIKTMSEQERHLSNLLDTLPDKVLICSQAGESRAAKSIYSNQ